MIQKYRFVERNMEMLRTLTKDGYVSPTLLAYYHIYIAYMKVKNKSKMERYRIVAQETNSSVRTCSRAVAEMKKYVRD